MMDADALFPEGFHPIETKYDPSYTHPIQPKSRSGVDIKYYFIDFGLSVEVSPETKYVLGIFGRDDTVPELSLTEPYDAFKVDIYIMGNMLKQTLCNVCISHVYCILLLPSALEIPKRGFSTPPD